MKNTVVVAHRGLSSKYPENTILSFQKAVEIKVDAIELDVRETKDGEIVIMHDEKVDRTTDGNGYVEQLTYSEIKKLDAGKWKGNFKDVKVPSLKEAFENIGNKIYYFIEIKKVNLSKVIKLIDSFNLKENIVLSSFHIEYLLETRKIAPEIPVAFITDHFPENINILIENGIRTLNLYHPEITDEKFIYLTKNGILTHVWTVDEKEDMEKYLNMEIPIITSNCPDLLLKVLGR